jgi:hypothetical protein
MIVFLTAPSMEYTHRDVGKNAEGFVVRVGNYRDLLQQQKTLLATYVFTDMDRLSLQHLHRVAAAYRLLRSAGLRVLNDPALAPSRYGLLRRLHEAGINDFNAYRVEERLRPTRWPVFLRTEGNHDRPLTDLVPDWDTLRRAIDDAVASGIPEASLLIVEYAAEPIADGLFRKLSSYRIGDRVMATTAVHEDKWLVKYGKKGIAGAALYEEELQIIKENRYADVMERAFELVGIEYGRSDYGVVRGRPQIYEINTNPEVKFGGNHPFEQRVQSSRIANANYLAALKAIDTTAPGDLLPIDIRKADAALAAAARDMRNAAASRIDVSGQAAAAGRESQ